MTTFTQRYALFLLPLLLVISNLSFAQSANFTADFPSGCSPLVVSFTNTSTGTTGTTTYEWDFGNSTPLSYKKDGSTTYTAPGTYTVKLTVTNPPNTPSIKTMTITVYPSPKAKYTIANNVGCPCLTVTFTNTSTAEAPGPYTSVWSFGDGNTSTSNSTTYTYCEPGRYAVALKVTNSAGCSNTILDTGKVVVHDRPEANFTSDKTTLCKTPDTVKFTPIITKGKPPYTYFWDFGDPPVTSTSTAANPSHPYTAPGTYTVKLIVTDANGCKDTIIKTSYINAGTINANFSGPAGVCWGNSATFINTSTPAPTSTRWYWDDGSTVSKGSPVSHTYKLPGTYNIMMIDSFGSCVDTIIKPFTLYPKPKPNFSYSPIYPCPAPATITFNNVSTGATSYEWIFGDGSGSTTTSTASFTHTYTYDSIFSVFLIATSAYGCKDTFRVRDTSKVFPAGYPNPFYDSFNSPIIIRVYDAEPHIFYDSAAGCLPFLFKGGAEILTNVRLPLGCPSSMPCPPVHYPGPPYWYPTYPVPDPYPDPFYDPPVTGAPHFPDRLLYPYPISTYEWDFGDGSPKSSASNPSHTYTIEGEYKIKVKITTNNGCVFYDSILLVAGNKPTALFTAAPSTICIHDTVVFTNNSINGTTYFWDFGDAGSLFDTSKKVKHRFDKSDTFKVVLTALRYGCRDTMSKNIIVNPPEATPELKYSCDTPLKVRFINKTPNSTSIIWRFGDGYNSSSGDVFHTYASPGLYTARLVAFNSIYGCADSMDFTVHVFIPNPNFTAADTTLCLGDTARFTGATTSYFTRYTWLTGDTLLRDTTITLAYRYRDTGSYTVSFIARDDHGCLDTITRTSYIIVGKPQMKLTVNPGLVGCAPMTLNLKDTSTDTKGLSIVSRKWDFGDASAPTTGPSPTITHTYAPGKYTLKLTATDNIGCKDSISVDIESRKPTAAFVTDVDTFSCIGKQNIFYNHSTGEKLTFFWDFGDGNYSTDENPKHAYSTLGSYNVKLVVTDVTGCKDSVVKTAYIRITRPTAAFTVSDSIAICPPLFVADTNKSSSDAVYFMWHFGNGGTSTIKNPVVPYVDSGEYIMMLVAFDKYGCTDTARRTMRVLGYDGALSYDPLEGCGPLTVNFETAIVNAPIMVWDFNDGTTENAVGKLKTKHVYSEPGKYVPKLVLGDGKGCNNSSKGIDTIKVDGVTGVITYKPNPACLGSEITFNDSSYSLFSTYASSLWTFHDNSTSTDKQPKHTYTEAGSFTVTLISTSARGCTDTVITSVNVVPLPKIKVKDTVICLNDTATLSPTGGTTYTWTPDPTISCTSCTNPKIYPLVPTTYYVTGVDENGCSNTDTVDVGIKTKTELILPPAAEICAEDSLRLLASGAFYYSWSPATNLNKTDVPNPVAYFTAATNITYTVIGSEGKCIPDTASINVTVHPLPVMNAGPDMQMLAGTPVILNGSGTDAKTFSWSPEDNLSCADCYTPTASPTVTTIYTLKGISEYGCVDSDQVTVYVFCDQSQLFIPNTFTPNGDGRNDVFYPHGKGINKVTAFRVYNRWGQVVFEKNDFNINDKDQGWDGTFKGEFLSPDTFVYIIEATCDNGNKITWKGDITLIR